MVTLYFIAVAVYVLFHNDIMGPMQFEISDRPFDVPAQFHRSWRYYWCMAYMHEVAWLWGHPFNHSMWHRKACEDFEVSKFIRTFAP